MPASDSLDGLLAWLVVLVAFIALIGTAAGLVAIGEAIALHGGAFRARYRRWLEDRPVTTSETGAR